MYPYIMPPQQQQTNWSPKEWGQFFKGLQGGKGKDKKDDNNDDGWIKVTTRKRKPRMMTFGQSLMLFLATFPLVGPLYYFSVLGSWELLKFGVSQIVK